MRVDIVVLNINHNQSGAEGGAPLYETQSRLDWEDICCRNADGHREEVACLLDTVVVACQLQPPLDFLQDTEESYIPDVPVDSMGFAGMVDGYVAVGKDKSTFHEEVGEDSCQGTHVHEIARMGNVHVLCREEHCSEPSQADVRHVY